MRTVTRRPSLLLSAIPHGRALRRPGRAAAPPLALALLVALTSAACASTAEERYGACYWARVHEAFAVPGFRESEATLTTAIRAALRACRPQFRALVAADGRAQAENVATYLINATYHANLSLLPE